MSPEQARSPRDVDARTDIYSVGAILYELLSGRTPYTSESGEFTELLFKIFTQEPEPLGNLRPDVPEGLAQVIHAALVRDPNMRYSSASDFAEALAPYSDERSQNVLTRLRGGRGRSLLPPTPSMTPPGQYGQAAATPARANTYQMPGDANRGVRVPTAAGVSKDSGGRYPRTAPGQKASKAPLAIAAFVVVLLLCSAGGVVIVKRSAGGPGPKATQDTVETAKTATPPPPPSSTGSPMSTGSSATPQDSASASSTATVLVPLPTPTNNTRPNPNPIPDTTGSGKPKAPANLNGVQPHF